MHIFKKCESKISKFAGTDNLELLLTTPGRAGNTNRGSEESRHRPKNTVTTLRVTIIGWTGILGYSPVLIAKNAPRLFYFFLCFLIIVLWK